MKINLFDKLLFIVGVVVIFAAWCWAGTMLIDELNTLGMMQARGIAPSFEELWPHIMMVLVMGSLFLAPFFMFSSWIYDYVTLRSKKQVKKEEREAL